MSKKPLTFAVAIRRCLGLSFCVVCLEAVVNISNHFVATDNVSTPPSYVEKTFCEAADKGIIFTDSGVGGSDLYKWDAGTKKARRIVPTPYRENNPDLSPDGSKIVCEYQDTDSSGLLLIDLQSKRYRKITINDAGEDEKPTFSPDGKRVAFVHSQEIAEVNLLTNQVKVLARKTYSHFNRVYYFSDNEVCYSGGRLGPASRDTTLYTGRLRIGQQPTETALPNHLYFQIIGVASKEICFYAASASSVDDPSRITYGESKNINSPKLWKTFVQKEGYNDKLASRRREILFLRYDSKGTEIVSGRSLADGKVRTYFPFDVDRH